MIEIAENIFAVVVDRGSCTRQFNKMVGNIGVREFTYFPLSERDPRKMNGYGKLVEGIELDWETQYIVIVKPK